MPTLALNLGIVYGTRLASAMVTGCLVPLITHMIFGASNPGTRAEMESELDVVRDYSSYYLLYILIIVLTVILMLLF